MNDPLATLSHEAQVELLRKMLLGRRFEERCAEMYAMQKIGGFCHLAIGQEAISVGALSTLEPDDAIFCSYRDHVHALTKGSDPERVMAELFGRDTGVSRGKGGSMHLFDREHGMLGGHAIVGGHIPLATGVAFAAKYEERPQVVLCFFGEAAVNIGAFHESLNMAALWKLPCIYIVENNRYGMGTPIERASAIYDIAARARRDARDPGHHGSACDRPSPWYHCHHHGWPILRSYPRPMHRPCFTRGCPRGAYRSSRRR